jgi:hypothetical protein
MTLGNASGMANAKGANNMAASNGVVGLDTTVEIGAGLSPEDYIAIAEPKDIDGPEITQEFADFTHMQSLGGFRERKPTFKSSGQVTFKCNYVAADPGQIDLIAAANAVPATLKYFKMTYPDNTIVSFAAYPSVKFSSPMAGALEIAVTLGLEGAFSIA